MIEESGQNVGTDKPSTPRGAGGQDFDVRSSDVRAEFDRLHHEVAESAHHLEVERGRVASMQSSWSWRLTLPLRILARLIRRLRPISGSSSAATLIEPSGVAEISPHSSPLVFPGRFALDLPSIREFAPGEIRFIGWCLGPGEIPPTALRVRADDKIFPARCDLPRPDVLTGIGAGAKSLRCGFDAFVTLARGPSQITIEGRFPGDTDWQRIDAFEVLAAHDAEGYDNREWRAYREWLKRNDLFDRPARARLAARCAAITNPVTISVLLPTWNTPEKLLRAAIESIRDQVYLHWQLCIVDDASDAGHVRSILAEYAALDPRIVYMIRPERGNISLATNSALELATGDWTTFLDHDDELHPAALSCLALEVAAYPNAELIYTDEDKIDADRRRSSPHFKTDWDPELLVGQNYVCHLAAYPTARLREIGGLRAGFEGCQDWDLVLRATRADATAKVRHIPRVLYHWRIGQGSTALAHDEKDHISERAERALREHFVRTGEPIDDIKLIAAGQWQIVRSVPRPKPLVSIVIPTRDQIDLLERCVESIREKTRYPHFEIVIVDNQSTDPRAVAKLQEWQQSGAVRVMAYDAPFNYSGLHNQAVPQCAGEFICLLNNDTEVIAADWLHHLVAQAMRPGVGAAGAMLLYPDDTIQHAGVILGLGGIGDHRHAREPRYCEGHMGRLRIAHQISAVTAACVVFRKAHFEAAGGLDESNLQVAYNDVDFCLRLLELGYRNIWTPLALLYHHESASRGYEDTIERRNRFRAELDYMRQRWGTRLEHDPAHNPNVTLNHKDDGLAAIPRVEPW